MIGGNNWTPTGSDIILRDTKDSERVSLGNEALPAIEQGGKFYVRTDKLEEFLEQAETCTKEPDSDSTSNEPLTGYTFRCRIEEVDQ